MRLTLGAEALRQALDGVLGGVVGAQERASEASADRRDVDDGAASLPAHDGQQMANRGRHAEHVHLELMLELLGGDPLERPEYAVASVVENGVRHGWLGRDYSLKLRPV